MIILMYKIMETHLEKLLKIIYQISIKILELIKNLKVVNMEIDLILTLKIKMSPKLLKK